MSASALKVIARTAVVRVCWPLLDAVLQAPLAQTMVEALINDRFTL
jgi:hypothetical protein